MTNTDLRDLINYARIHKLYNKPFTRVYYSWQKAMEKAEKEYVEETKPIKRRHRYTSEENNYIVNSVKSRGNKSIVETLEECARVLDLSSKSLYFHYYECLYKRVKDELKNTNKQRKYKVNSHKIQPTTNLSTRQQVSLAFVLLKNKIRNTFK